MAAHVRISTAGLPDGGPPLSPPLSPQVGVFDRAADTYDQLGVDMFQSVAEWLVVELSPTAGERALDIGCGRGAVLTRLARAVLPDGHATGIDMSPRMVELAKSDLEAVGVRAEVVVSDAMAPEFDRASFDLVAASLVVFFLPDPLAALRAWRELLIDGGRVGISTFGPFSDAWRAVNGVFRPYLPAEPPPSAAAFGSDAAVESLLRQSGFANPRTATRELAVRFESKDHWHEWSWSQGTRGMWERVPASQRPAVLEQAFDALESCRDEQGRIGYDQTIRLSLAAVEPPPHDAAH